MPSDSKTNRTRDGILLAAEGELLRFGYRKASMEGVARAAGVAKPTVYAYFRTKQSLLDAISARRSEILASEARAAANAAATPQEAVVASVAAKFCAMHDFLAASPHGGELLEASLGADNDATAASHVAYISELSTLLEGAGVQAKDAPELAEVLNRAALGIMRGATSTDELRRHLCILFHRLLPAD